VLNLNKGEGSSIAVEVYRPLTDHWSGSFSLVVVHGIVVQKFKDLILGRTMNFPAILLVPVTQ